LKFLKTLTSFIQKYRKNYLAVAGFAFIVVCVFISILGYLITPDQSPSCNEMNLQLGLKPPGMMATFVEPLVEESNQNFIATMLYGKERSTPTFLWNSVGDTSLVQVTQYQLDKSTSTPEIKTQTRRYFLGTDVFGRDVWSRVLLGTRVSLSVGLISVLISLVLGLFFGLCAGYYRGWVDKAIMWLINVIWSLPTLLLVIAITFALGKGFWQIFVAVGLTMWVELARIVRGQVFSLREQEFVQAAGMLGYSDVRIMIKHILPNLLGPIVVICAANFASAILLEAGLSFLGLGVQPPLPSWGQMLNENYAYIAFNKVHLALAPGIAIMLLVMSFNFVGNGLRDALDVKL
jgi:ABC-type dipeptide/oligopeptide/nickel transport system permease subunit